MISNKYLAKIDYDGYNAPLNTLMLCDPHTDSNKEGSSRPTPLAPSDEDGNKEDNPLNCPHAYHLKEGKVSEKKRGGGGGVTKPILKK